ncbi:hypothetical protein TVAG_000500 [Trichomonas vaginalis G3]|uniref:Uncharacterized protein n=1 Tax=Trichomonas vaginalis (strain ATCC PRA-98 / G3) TaxID=412133 RepID=A2EHS6_TRIV3|nr:phosphatidylinositol-3-phosphate biosynthetic process [Trichomonas vaginalis G3]EAY07766.1 hypothetical protein TVAG_000500 [Trichomonas vaginalis G3]KAI5542959.1 phosphatidylinositol-3-phosphate biosynthetic process [Trichomonas vaginalis G3]|eukprot:XP_001319989.1 hypothetical protein [Trichomonas vaginalis G3]
MNRETKTANSSAVFVSLKSKKNYLIVHPAGAEYYHVIKFEPYYGIPCYAGIFKKDILSTEEEALSYISNDEMIETMVKAHSIFGYTTIDKAGILILTKSVDTLYKYKNEHPIYKIKEVEFVRFSILIGEPSQDFSIEKLRSYPFSCNHYFCPTFDISKHFTRNSNYSASVNETLAVAFENIQIPNLCPRVIQGSFAFCYIDVFLSDVLLISRKITSNKKKERGFDINGESNMDYEIEIAYVVPRGSGYETISHVFYIGDVPSVSDTYKLEESQEKKVVKNYFKNLSKISGFNNILNIMLFNESKNPSYAKLMNKIQSFCNYEENNLKVSMIKTKFAFSSDKLDNIPSVIDLFYSVSSSKFENFGMSRIFENKTTTEIASIQQGAFRFSFVDSIEEELFAILSLLIKSIKPTNIITTNIQSFTDFSQISQSFIQLCSKFIISTAHSMRSFGNIGIGILKKIVTKFANVDEKFKDFPLYDNFEISISMMSMLQPLTMTCASFQANAAIMEPQNIGNSLLRQSFKPISFSIENPLTLILSKPIFLTEIVFGLSENQNFPISPATVHISAGLYNNRQFDVTEIVSLPISHEKTNICSVKLSDNNTKYDQINRVYEVEPVRFLSFEFTSPLSNYATLNGICVFGYDNPPFSYPFTNQNRARLTDDRRRVVLMECKNHKKREDIIPESIQYEITRVTGLHSVGEAQTKLVSMDIHPDTYDLGLLLNLNKTDQKNRKKKICRNCNQEKNTCLQCSFCMDWFCNEHITNFKENKVCRFCYQQLKQLQQSIEVLNSQKIQSYLDLNPFIQTHKKSIDFLKYIQNLQNSKSDKIIVDSIQKQEISKPTKSEVTKTDKNEVNSNQKQEISKNAKSEVFKSEVTKYVERRDPEIICKYPYFALINEQPLGENKIPFETVFCDSRLVYKPNVNMMHVLVALESYMALSGVEIVCDKNLTVTINNVVLHFSPPCSYKKCKINSRFLEIVIVGEEIELRRIKIFGKPVKNKVEIKQILAANQPKFVMLINYSSTVEEKNLIHTLSFEKVAAVSGLRFFKTWKNLHSLVIEVKTPKGNRYMHRFISYSQPKECDILLPNKMKATQIRVFYIQSTEKDAESILSNLPPIPFDVRSAK